jgi:hypothetical protein
MGKPLCYVHNVLDLARPSHSGWQAASWGSLGRVCEVGPIGPCAHGLQAHVFAALAQRRARPAAAKTDVAARLGRNATRVRFSRARLRAAH